MYPYLNPSITQTTTGLFDDCAPKVTVVISETTNPSDRPFPSPSPEQERWQQRAAISRAYAKVLLNGGSLG